MNVLKMFKHINKADKEEPANIIFTKSVFREESCLRRPKSCSSDLQY